MREPDSGRAKSMQPSSFTQSACCILISLLLPIVAIVFVLNCIQSLLIQMMAKRCRSSSGITNARPSLMCSPGKIVLQGGISTSNRTDGVYGGSSFLGSGAGPFTPRVAVLKKLTVFKSDVWFSRQAWLADSGRNATVQCVRSFRLKAPALRTKIRMR